ncbi:response regulator transcription factor [Halieaceae bacterium IMCC14734]|uniref:Response regulator transcription factor n=1 Tax=Candidatus Litorirhabdus singularis TaxID=2518993 RepID=A0ABT3TI79_9GAMM|nr:response regulator transcription factor [Candidatus Litorirhabdus singularis]MCX2981915.1 response regulator transcription factor [Candidatus Litorirhabdus singularis]
MTILIIEDDAAVAQYIADGLRDAGYATECVADGEIGYQRAVAAQYEMLLVDRMLPHLDGLSLISRLREQGDHTPALVLSALGEVDDRVKGLQCGADDYLVKPFSFAELKARTEALLRRNLQNASTQTTLVVADLTMDLLTQQVARAGQKLSLQPREYKLLECLMRNGGQLVTRDMLLEDVWGYHFDPQTNVIDVHISRLRQKIDRDFEPALLTTVRGSGYILGVPAE